MPYINVVLKDGKIVTVADADQAEWVLEQRYSGAPNVQGNRVMRLVCKKGEDIIARFNNEDVAGYTWNDGKP